MFRGEASDGSTDSSAAAGHNQSAFALILGFRFHS